MTSTPVTVEAPANRFSQENLSKPIKPGRQTLIPYRTMIDRLRLKKISKPRASTKLSANTKRVVPIPKKNLPHHGVAIDAKNPVKHFFTKLPVHNLAALACRNSTVAGKQSLFCRESCGGFKVLRLCDRSRDLFATLGSFELRTTIAENLENRS